MEEKKKKKKVNTMITFTNSFSRFVCLLWELQNVNRKKKKNNEKEFSSRKSLNMCVCECVAKVRKKRHKSELDFVVDKEENNENMFNRSALETNELYRWYADTIVYGGFGPLIACLGIVGGTLSCLVFRRKPLKKKSCSVYFLFLALADLLCMICWLIHFVLPTYQIHLLTFSNFFCKIFVFSMYFAFDLANYILTAW